VIELKNAVDENATIKSAFSQLQTYKQAIPSLFTYNELMIVSDGWDALCGTVTSDFGRFMSWKTKDGKTTADTFATSNGSDVHGMLNKQTLLDLIRHFIVFEKSEDKTLKKGSGLSSILCCKQSRRKHHTNRSSRNRRPRGRCCLAHTRQWQKFEHGFYSGKLIIEPRMDNPTLVVLTDRNDLDDQLYETFTNCQQLLRQEPQQAEDRKHLRKPLKVCFGRHCIYHYSEVYANESDIISKIHDNGVKNQVLNILVQT
jgi:type I restriction enzyme R subunit